MTRPIPPAEFAAADTVVLDSCWKRIGIHGDKSCPELAKHAHCRDCATFAHAAATLLDRELPDLVADAAGLRSAAAAAATDTESAMMFRIGHEWFALPTLSLDEIVGIRRVHSLPHRRNPAVLGLVNVHGELVICVSLAMLLACAVTDAPDGRLIILRHPGGRLAFPVHEVQHTHHYSASELQPVPTTVARLSSSLTRGLLPWRDRMVARIDEQRLFDALGASLV